jgi:hypothetical protein
MRWRAVLAVADDEVRARPAIQRHHGHPLNAGSGNTELPSANDNPHFVKGLYYREDIVELEKRLHLRS